MRCVKSEGAGSIQAWEKVFSVSSLNNEFFVILFIGIINVYNRIFYYRNFQWIAGLNSVNCVDLKLHHTVPNVRRYTIAVENIKFLIGKKAIKEYVHSYK